MSRSSFAGIVAACLLLVSDPSLGRAGIIITRDTNVTDLVNALTAGGGAGLVVTGATLDAQSFGSFRSSGTYTVTGALPTTYGLQRGGIVFSTGDVADYQTGPNIDDRHTTNYSTGDHGEDKTTMITPGVSATPAQNALLKPISGQDNHYDVTELTINFVLRPGFDRVFFDTVFGSDEFPEFRNTQFVDAFGMYLDGQNIAVVGGSPVNINHPDFRDIPGTELDGVLAPGGNPVVRFSPLIGAGPHSLTFILGDTSDGQVDTTVYFSALGGSPPSPSGVPEPNSLILLAMGLLSVAGYGKCRRRRTE